MRVGQQFPVALAGHHVCDAVAEEVENGEVILYIPATRVKMAYTEQVSITPPTPEVEHHFAGLETPTGPLDAPASDALAQQATGGSQTPAGGPQSQSEPVANTGGTTPLEPYVEPHKLDSSVLDD